MSTTTATRRGQGRPESRSRRRVEPIFYFFLLPSLVLFTLAITVPGLVGIFFSFTDSIGIGDWEFAGLTNYIAIFSDPAILQSYLFTFGFSIVTVLVVNVIAFLLAVGLTSQASPGWRRASWQTRTLHGSPLWWSPPGRPCPGRC